VLDLKFEETEGALVVTPGIKRLDALVAAEFRTQVGGEAQLAEGSHAASLTPVLQPLELQGQQGDVIRAGAVVLVRAHGLEHRAARGRQRLVIRSADVDHAIGVQEEPVSRRQPQIALDVLGAQTQADRGATLAQRARRASAWEQDRRWVARAAVAQQALLEVHQQVAEGEEAREAMVTSSS
jgi:hypothetical protein